MIKLLRNLRVAGIRATVSRRGYRFLAPVTVSLGAVPGPAEFLLPLTTQTSPGEPPDMPAVSLRAVEAPLPDALPPREVERRSLTVLCCGLVDATRLAVCLDPEDYREVVRTYHQTCAEVMQRFGGYMAQYLGGGVLGYFGYPVAHEDNAQRAVWAGLSLLAALAPLNTQLALPPGEQVAVRLGAHTGFVVLGAVGEGRSQEPLALGETPNIAERLSQVAQPNTLVISAATYHLIEGYFACEMGGEHPLPGLLQPLAVYRVLGASGLQNRFDIAVGRGLTPLVGRTPEVEILVERWTRVQEGMGQVVLLVGEPGIGKSRLVQALQNQIMRQPHIRVECRCSPYHQHSALAPVIAHLERALAWDRDACPQAKLRTLEEALAQHPWPLPEVVPLLAELLSLPLAAAYSPLALTPERQKQKTLEALLAWLLVETEQHPVLFIVEDLHWVDPSTLEWLSLVVEQSPTARLYGLFTCRPEFALPWSARAHLTSLTLSRLSRPQATQMVHSVTGGKALPADVLAQIVAKADGVPLFVEELTKAVLESGLLREREGVYEVSGPLPPLAIPATLQDSLMVRLDRLTTVKAVAQLGATLGRQFDYETLQAVSSLDAAVLQQGLRQLVEAEIVYQRGVPPQATYLFKHALIQDAAYQSLLKRTRQQYHRRIAQFLAERCPDTVATQPELLAHHSTEAGLAKQAVEYWSKAGQRAHERSAHGEAIGHLRKGLELLTTLPDTPEHRQQELALQITLGAALTAIKGLAAPDVEAAYQRARRLCQQVGETLQLVPVLGGLVRFYIGRGESQTARELGEQMLSLVQRVHDPAGFALAHLTMGNVLFFLQAWDAARTHLEQGSAFYNAPQHRSQGFLTETHQGVFGLSRLAQILWYLGYPDQALQRSHEALTLARELAHPASVATALYFAADVHGLRREVQRTYELAEAALGLAREHEFAFRVAQAMIQRGWALVVAQGQGETGLTQICQGLAALRATGSETGAYLILLVAAYWRVGQIEEGLRVAEEALAVSRRNAGLYRLKGELLLRRSAEHHAEAERCFRQALEIARRQGAKSLELRAATSLARLWQQQGKRAEAYALLAPLYGWFTEGFNTADLQDAKVLLDALGGAG